MPIFQVAEYQVRPSAVAKIKEAIQQFVHAVENNEPGTLLYSAWQQRDQPAHFTHFFVFEDAAAREKHYTSRARKAFEAVCAPELTGEGVVSTDYDQVATNQWLQTAVPH